MWLLKLRPIQSSLQIWMQDKSICTWDALNDRIDSLLSRWRHRIGGYTHTTHIFLYEMQHHADPSDEHQFLCNEIVTEQAVFLGGTQPPMSKVVPANSKRVAIRRIHGLLLQCINSCVVLTAQNVRERGCKLLSGVPASLYSRDTVSYCLLCHNEALVKRKTSGSFLSRNTL